MGATSASDIWSLGCVIIELLQGRPPYSDLDQMAALFHIVDDEHPPFPEGASLVSPTQTSKILFLINAGG